MKKQISIILLLLICYCGEAQYCTPAYLQSCNSGDFIDEVNLAGINNRGTGCNGNPSNFIFDTSDTANVFRGSSVQFTITPSDRLDQGLGIWIDFNSDQDFEDPGEFVFAVFTPTVEPVRGLINIPQTATLGITRIRIRTIFVRVLVSSDDCSVGTFGETEDYPILIQEKPFF